MRWLLPMVGVAVIGAAMADLARTLFHPSEHGSITDFLTLHLWRACHRFAPKLVRMMGPVNFFVVILYWGLSVVVGFAFVYLPLIPGQFVLSQGMDTARFAAHPVAYAGTLSLASLITVALGIQTSSAALQFAMGLEAVLGFVILTASISWILSIYSVIEHRRSLAHEVTLLHFAEQQGIKCLERLPDTDLQSLLFAKVEQVITIRTELSQFPITYYFQERDPQSAIGPALFYLAELAQDMASQKPNVILAATLLGGAIDDLLKLVSMRFLGHEFDNRWATLNGLNADHQRTPLHRASRN